MTYDIIASLPGFNKSALVGVDIPAADLGTYLAQFMGTRAESHYEGGDRMCNVTVHVHPTFWPNLPVMTPVEAINARGSR